MSYRVRFTSAAEKDLDRLPGKIREQAARHLRALAEDPRPPQFRPLTEKELRGSCRVRVGRDYRIGYRIDDAAREVVVWLIGHRTTFYELAKRRQQ